ncbi:hypothetical protein [Rhizobium sp. NFR03]|uniref:hypothetical protein n=1 Tax=Rhizobium sp. NFR03 TaxID=1566263 RepID=UPI001AECDF0A|nr:hypothetical protein [Rhizobium sp. NFR03]
MMASSTAFIWRSILCADPSDNGGKTLAVIGNLQGSSVRQAVQIDMVFRDVCADGNIRHLFSSPMLVIRALKLGYPFRTIGKDGDDQTLTRPGIRQNGGLAFHDPSPIAGREWPSSPALLYLTKKHGNHKTSISGEHGFTGNALSSCFLRIVRRRSDPASAGNALKRKSPAQGRALLVSNMTAEAVMSYICGK